MVKWHLLEYSKKYNLPLTVIITSLAICSRLYDRLDEIDEFDDEMAENWETCRNMVEDEPETKDYLARIHGYTLFNRLSLPLTSIIILLSCKIHNLTPLIPRSLPNGKFWKKSQSEQPPEKENDVQPQEISETFNQNIEVESAVSDAATVSKTETSQAPPSEESDNPQPAISSDKKQHVTLDAASFNQIEAKIFELLNYNLSVPDSAGILLEISNKLMFTNEQTINLLEQLLVVHMDGRIKQFNYFTALKEPESGSQSVTSSSVSSENTQYSSSQGSIPNSDSICSQKEENVKKSPVDVLNKAFQAQDGTRRRENVEHSENSEDKRRNSDLLEGFTIEDPSESVLAYDMADKSVDEHIQSRSDSQACDRIHSNIIDCCLALLKEEDLIQYEITLGENRNEAVRDIKRAFTMPIPFE